MSCELLKEKKHKKTPKYVEKKNLTHILHKK